MRCLIALAVAAYLPAPSAAESCTAATPAPPAAHLVAADVRDCAVKLARTGQLGEALQILERLHEAHPADLSTQADLAVVAHWAGQEDRTLALLDGLAPETLPGYVLEAYAKAARNRQRWDQSLALYDRIAGDSESGSALKENAEIARALVLADADRFDAALAAIAALTASAPADAAPSAERYAACGYVNARAQHYTAALACYGRALRADPAHAEARRGHIMAASALGAAVPALELARAHPDLLTPAELVRLELDAAAQELRWALLPASMAQAERRQRARAALAAHGRLSQDLATSHHADHARTLRFDRVAALVADFRMADAAAEFEALEAEGLALDDFPVYVLAAAGEAYSYLRRPGHAATAYEAALRQAPDNFELRIGLFYARSDLSDYAGARAVAEGLLAAEAPWFNPAPGRYLPNARYAEAREAAALELAFRDDYAAALAQLDALLELAPANHNLRLSRAELLRWRGWPEAARRDLERVRQDAPGFVRAEVVAGHVELDSRRYEQAAAAVEWTGTRAPDARATLDLAERWRNHNRPELVISGSVGRSDGDALSSRDWQLDSYYFTAPLRYRYRLFVHDVYRYGRFDEGTGRDHRLGAGVEYRAPRWSGRAEVNRGLEQNRAAGAAGELNWHASDQIELQLRGRRNSANLPLRATRAGVEADELEVAAGYRWHEARAASAAAGVIDFDDGNLRRWLQLAYRSQVLNRPEHKLFAEIRGYASRNSASDRVYFNPEADRQATLGLVHEWRVFRDHQRGLTQRLGAEAGSYWQDDFGAGPVWTLFVEHDWALDARTRIRYGFSGGARRYDGEREHVLSAQLTLERRL